MTPSFSWKGPAPSIPRRNPRAPTSPWPIAARETRGSQTNPEHVEGPPSSGTGLGNRKDENSGRQSRGFVIGTPR
jgi:hypothetical protein